MSLVIEVNKLNKSYAGQCVVDNISVHIHRGECYGLLGPNGAGKSTTLRLLLGLTDPDSGTVKLLDQEVPHHARVARLKIGVVPQIDNLDPDFTVEEMRCLGYNNNR